MRTIAFSLLIIALISFPGCKYHCDGYPDFELKWIPYHLSDKLKYFNKSDTFEISVNDFYITQPSSFHGIFMDIRCGYDGYYQTTISNLGYFVKEEIISEGHTDDGIYIHLSENDEFFFNIWMGKSYQNSINVKYFADSIINQINYQEVFLVSKDTIDKSPRIAWIIKAKDKGIVEFYDFQSKKKWQIVNQ